MTTPCHRPILLSSTIALSLALTSGCAKKTDDTQNPDDASQGDGASDSGGEGDAVVASRARPSTSTRGGRHTEARVFTPKKPPRPIPGGDDDGGTGGDDDPVDEGPNGLLAEAFTLDSPEALPEAFDGLGVVQAFFVPDLQVNTDDAANGFPGLTDLTENYALRFTGSINITQDAEYDLCVYSDDGSQLYLEDTLVVDNDGVHEEAVEACELVYLPPGEYRVEIRYFQASGPLLALSFAWAIDGGDKELVPTEVLFKPDAAADDGST